MKYLFLLFLLGACAHDEVRHRPLTYVKHTRYSVEECAMYYGHEECVYVPNVN